MRLRGKAPGSGDLRPAQRNPLREPLVAWPEVRVAVQNLELSKLQSRSSGRMRELRLFGFALSVLLLLPRPSVAQDLAEATRSLSRALEKNPSLLRFDASKHKKDLSTSGKLAPDLALVQLAKKEKRLEEVELDLGAVIEDQRVAVVLTPSNPRARSALEREVRSLGGKITGTLGGAVLARVPVARLKSLGESDALRLATLQPKMVPYALTGDGVEAARARVLHKAGLTGKGAKVGILDFGFARYEALQAAGEVPPPVARETFSARTSADEVHGTACAEIIHEMAPDAKLYLAEMSGAADEFILAARWLAEQGVDIISYSGGGHYGPHDGRALPDLLVTELVEKHGVLWINAAGNEGSSHWAGETRDDDGNGFVDIPGAPAPAVVFATPGGYPFFVLANWNDWGPNPLAPTATTDIDLVVFRRAGPDSWERVGESTLPQAGNGPPIEGIGARDMPEGIFAIVLRATNLTRRVPIHLFLTGVSALQPLEPRGSIGIPATAKAAVAVGAVHVDDGKLAPYSSQGPTDDKRVKPDVAAPSNNLSLAYGADGGTGRFTGTSAACPHVSGFAALLHQRTPNASVQALRASTIEFVRAMGTGRPNNQFGFGHIDGEKVPTPRRRPSNPDEEESREPVAEEPEETAEEERDPPEDEGEETADQGRDPLEEGLRAIEGLRAKKRSQR